MAAVETRDIIIGSADLYVAAYQTTDPFPPIAASSDGYRSMLESSGATGSDVWTYVGATQDGIEIAYEPTYNDVMVDQIKDALLTYADVVSMNVRTNLVEATLQNLIYAWGLDSDDLVGNKVTINQLSDTPTERMLCIVGDGADMAADAPASGGEPGIERIYQCFRVVSVDASSHSYQRAGEVVFPITFRLLQDTSRSDRFGRVIDRKDTTSPFGRDE